jgi:hypothetical protein
MAPRFFLSKGAWRSEKWALFENVQVLTDRM